MIQVIAKQASNELDDLLKRVTQGQEIVIIGSDGSAFKLLPLPRQPQPVFGSAQGTVHIGPDFADPIEGFEDGQAQSLPTIASDLDDPLEALIGGFSSNVPDWTEHVDYYLGQNLLQEMSQTD